MTNRLADAISPYLRSHAENPVDWQPWSAAAFDEARARDVPVLVSIGYSTCHWCHVMARESFSDPVIAAYLNENFVSIKVDREEHPDVDASYLAAAGAFTQNLGWPLNVFVTPAGRPFYAGTYSPPAPMPGHPAFREVLAAVTDAWTTRRDAVEDSAAGLADALAQAAPDPGGGELPGQDRLAESVDLLATAEDPVYGGFGGAPKFPASPTLALLLDRADGRDLALRTLKRLGATPLRDSVEGGFFRYAVNRDWSEPHYERMLYDNAQLLELYTRAWMFTGEAWARLVSEGLVRFLGEVLQLPDGGFASAQDSESTVDGVRVEGGYYALDEDSRHEQVPPALDTKMLTGWNGLAIGALALAGAAWDDDTALTLARRAADRLLELHRREDGALVRASIDGRLSSAVATLEDYGMFAAGLLDLATATGEVRYAVAARELVDRTLPDLTSVVFVAPEGADPVLTGHGLDLATDPSEGAYPSGLSAIAAAAWRLYVLTGAARYRQAATAAMVRLVGSGSLNPLAFGAALRLVDALTSSVRQLVVVTPDSPAAGATATGATPVGATSPGGLVDAARRRSGLVAVVTEEQGRDWAAAGFDLFAHRGVRDGVPTAYQCRDFVCRLPVTETADLV
ncbi:thioredoxin domain-containing protein [Cryobacterium sp. PAMC25264]|uniref:thioredoxin domain-containing protein n=1 Tax=Cryobacterium sp. PAMC25264 TaxID=2861288 RepID=UPI001C62A2BE|nr:thioredoxin domain-containing protein [Cryobacterium sp. PAMC25264]QYF72438.1 thioredoxin domain-containing protein [Cryobacterium sp. PAMC25264]